MDQLSKTERVKDSKFVYSPYKKYWYSPIGWIKLLHKYYTQEQLDSFKRIQDKDKVLQ